MARLNRRQAIQKANALGLSLRGFSYYKQGGQLALAERSPRGIRRQARKEAVEAFRPYERELTRREQSEQALANKRMQDEDAFAKWVAQTQNDIQTKAQTRDAELSGMAAQRQTDLEARLKEVGTAHAKRLDDQGIAAPFDPLLDAQATSIAAQGANAVTAGAARQRLSGELTAGLASNNINLAAARRGRTAAENARAFTQIQDARTKLAGDKAGFLSKRGADLQSAEATKAQARIAAQQFETKARLDMIKFGAGQKDKRLARRLQKRQQDLAHQDRVAQRALTDKNARNRFIKDTGYSPEEYAKLPRKKRIAIAQDKTTKSVEDKVNDPVRRARANDAIGAAKRRAQTNFADLIKDKKEDEIVRALVENGVDESVARVAAYRLRWPGRPLNAGMKEHWKRAVLVQSGSS